MISEKEFENFNPKFEIVSCFLEHDGKFLVLHRHDDKPQGNTWGVPAGKVDREEDLKDSIIREIGEEVGKIMSKERLSYFKKLFVRYDDYDFVYHMFHISLDDIFDVLINEKEHKDFKWVTPEEALGMDLIQDEDYCVKCFYGIGD